MSRKELNQDLREKVESAAKHQVPQEHQLHHTQEFDNARFYANSREGMKLQAEIVKYHIKMTTLRTLSAYSISSVFGVAAACIVIFAPSDREVAANLFAGSFLVLALGIAGFTRFVAKVPGVKIDGSTDRSSN